MSGFFQRLFGKDNKPAIARGPLGLHLNSGFTLDTLAFRLLEDELLIALPGEEFTVAAVSHIDLGGGSQIFRYYTSGDEFLQINTTGGEDIDDFAFVPMPSVNDSVPHYSLYGGTPYVFSSRASDEEVEGVFLVVDGADVAQLRRAGGVHRRKGQHPHILQFLQTGFGVHGIPSFGLEPQHPAFAPGLRGGVRAAGARGVQPGLQNLLQSRFLHLAVGVKPADRPAVQNRLNHVAHAGSTSFQHCGSAA